jgi:competence protein ComEC
MVLTAIGVAAGSLVARHVPAAWFLTAAGLALVGVAARRPYALIVGLAVVSSVLAARAWDGLRPPPAAVVQQQWVTLLTDPAPFPGGSVGADVRLDHRHVSAFARGPAGDAMSAHLAGEHLRVTGVLRPLVGVQRARLAPRHIAARLSVSDVSGARPANFVGSVANAYRRVVARGATALPERLRPLFGGMVLGDDRGESPELQDAFRAAGLTHLMVVSGENVAFALLVASPLIRRGGLHWRFGATLLVLGAFGVLTRWEPSVLRAEAMAAVAAAGALVGRPVPALRLLALAVTGCVLIDPLLVHSVGFRLSAAAVTGLVVLTPVLQRRRVPLLLAASIGAQVGAAVVLVPTFGTVPLVSLPANVVAVPLAGPLMMWGLTAGPVAGLFTPLATAIHLPTHAALARIAGVATWSARLPLAPVGVIGGLLLVLAGTAALVPKQTSPRWRPAMAMGATTAVVAVILFALGGPPPAAGVELDPGTRLWVVGGHSALLLSGRASSTLLDALRVRHVHRLDVLVVTRPGSAAADAAWPIVQAMRPRVVLAPEHHQLAGAHTARRGAVVTVGSLGLRVTDGGPPLTIEVTDQRSDPVYRHPGDPPPR